LVVSIESLKAAIKQDGSDCDGCIDGKTAIIKELEAENTKVNALFHAALTGQSNALERVKEPSKCKAWNKLPDAPEKPMGFEEFQKEIGNSILTPEGEPMLEEEVRLWGDKLRKLYDRMGAGECPKVEWKTINGFKRGYLGKMFLGEFESLGNGNEFCRIQYPHEWAFAGPEGTGTRKIEEYARNIWKKTIGGK
jgi:hypothetical protein